MNMSHHAGCAKVRLRRMVHLRRTPSNLLVCREALLPRLRSVLRPLPIRLYIYLPYISARQTGYRSCTLLFTLLPTVFPLGRVHSGKERFQNSCFASALHFVIFVLIILSNFYRTFFDAKVFFGGRKITSSDKPPTI